MQKALTLGSLLCVAACGGTQKTAAVTAAGGPTTAMASVDAAGNDLPVPAVDPGLCDTNTRQVVQFDLNKDKQPDVWKLYKTKSEKGTQVQALTCKQADIDHDGRKDYVVQYDDGGNILVEEYDFDFDGRFDTRYFYDKKTGKRYLIERETGFDNHPDIWEKFDKSEKLESLRRDRNGDHKPDYWEQYRAGVLDAILYDDDFDGKVDRQDAVQPPSGGSSQAEGK